MTEYTTEELTAKIADAMNLRRAFCAGGHWTHHITDKGDIFDPLTNPADCEAVEIWAASQGWYVDVAWSSIVVVASAWMSELDSEIFGATVHHDGTPADMLRAKREAIVRAVVAAWEVRS